MSKKDFPKDFVHMFCCSEKRKLKKFLQLRPWGDDEILVWIWYCPECGGFKNGEKVGE